jgi:uncharacterized protein YjeT (DUF2065 family)
VRGPPAPAVVLGDLLTAFALMMVFEGIMPFLNPSRFRRTLVSAARLDDRSLRVAGLVCMIGGVVLLYAVH